MEQKWFTVILQVPISAFLLERAPHSISDEGGINSHDPNPSTLGTISISIPSVYTFSTDQLREKNITWYYIEEEDRYAIPVTTQTHTLHTPPNRVF